MQEMELPITELVKGKVKRFQGAMQWELIYCNTDVEIERIYGQEA